jgi:5-methylcytosine-specific restriction endonuclease McrA
MWSPRWDQHGGDYWHQATIDHIIPIAKGGKSHKENLQVMCRGCNHAKADAERLFVLEDA